MKKNLFSICMLLLCTCILSSKTFAQDDTGGSSDGIQGGSTDGGGVTALSAPPAGVKNIKRNNGNGTAINGVAEARLNFSNVGQISADIKLYKIAYLSDVSIEVPGAVTTWPPMIEKGYISYALGKNINPAKKLMFYFHAPTGDFAIPEN